MATRIYTGDKLVAGGDGRSAYQSWLDEGNTGTEEEFVASLNGVGIQSVVQTTTSTAPGGTNVVTVTKTDGSTSTFQFLNGTQGNTGSSVSYPYELINNLTTDDATKGLSAAQGVTLKGQIDQLGLEVNGATLSLVLGSLKTADGTEQSSTTRARTDYMANPGEIYFDSDVQVSLRYYDANKVFQLSDTSWTTASPYKLDDNYPIVRIVVAYTNNAAISDVTALGQKVRIKGLEDVVEELGSTVATQGEEITDLNAEVRELFQLDPIITDVPISRTRDNYYLNANNGSLASLGGAFNGYIYRTSFYQISPGVTYKVVVPRTGPNTAFAVLGFANTTSQTSRLVNATTDRGNAQELSTTLTPDGTYAYLTITYCYSDEQGTTVFGEPTVSYETEQEPLVDELRGVPYITLPSVIYAVVGKELNIYKDALVSGIDRGLASPSNVNVEIKCNIGYDYQRQYSVTPTASNVGDHTITVNAYTNKLLASATATLRVINDAALSAAKNILMIGDSTLECVSPATRGIVTKTLLESFSGTQPTSWGSINNGPYPHEGVGGWGVANFTSRGTVTAMNATDYKFYELAVADTTGIKVDAKYYPANDSSARLTIKQIFANAIQYLGYTGTPTSPLTKVSGNGPDTIEFTSAGTQFANPFWNPSTSAIDIAYFRSRIGFTGTFDAVSIRLGINDAQYRNIDTDAKMSTTITRLKALLAAILADNASTKIVIELPTLDVSDRDGWGVSEKAGSNSMAGKYEYQLLLWKWRKRLLDEFDSGAYNANVVIGCAGLCLDRWYGYPCSRSNTDVPATMAGVVASRYSQTSAYHNNAVHPNNPGYQQLADALYPQLLYLLQ